MAVAGAAQGPVGSPCGALYAPHQEVGRDGQGDRAGDWEGNFVKPRPWYNFWSKSETTIDGKDYVNGPKGVIHPGEMSGTPWDPKVHGVAKHPVTGNNWLDPETSKPIPISGPEDYIPVKPKA
ncbi:hypothetical protein WMF28_25685 [Sorangium sp. So ce590]|uniref:hypothetical protein n=1 Tax=Sorangium sp. So ce590 TaxID=3133317 RepID=UPI003F63C2CA